MVPLKSLASGWLSAMAWIRLTGMQKKCAFADFTVESFQPGKPQQIAYVERLNRTVRYEWLSPYYWFDLEEVQLFATQWMYDYRHDRPNMALGGFTPKQRLAMAA
jgi:putative transposase